jgi:1,4-dihydroxy-2-naphthoyl-CoA hydrolase
MFAYRRFIRLKDTDATGVLYFSRQLEFAQEAFEAYLQEKEISLNQLFNSYHFPIVHASSDYLHPLSIGDEIEISLQIDLGTTSFTLISEILLLPSRQKVGAVKLIHVAVSKETKKAVPFPASFVYTQVN